MGTLGSVAVEGLVEGWWRPRNGNAPQVWYDSVPSSQGTRASWSKPPPPAEHGVRNTDYNWKKPTHATTNHTPTTCRFDVLSISRSKIKKLLSRTIMLAS